MKSFHVELEVLTTHVLQINANSSEEAISIAEIELLEGEDIGEIVDSEIVSADAVDKEVVQ